MESLSFEEAYRKLEDIVRKLEAGGLPLEESIALYEEGMKLVRYCEELLEKAELRIRQIRLEQGGNWLLLPFEPEDGR
jgi:exodeoxyribonuclease VII small subunit